MLFWYALNLLLLIFEIVTRWHEAEISLLIVAGSVWVTVILFTVVFLVPINDRMARLNPDSLSEAAQREHKKWDALHRLRVLAVSVALICFLLRTHRYVACRSITLQNWEANSWSARKPAKLLTAPAGETRRVTIAWLASSLL